MLMSRFEIAALERGELAPSQRAPAPPNARFVVSNGLPSPTFFAKRFGGFTALMAEMRAEPRRPKAKFDEIQPFGPTCPIV